MKTSAESTELFSVRRRQRGGRVVNGPLGLAIELVVFAVGASGETDELRFGPRCLAHNTDLTRLRVDNRRMTVRSGTTAVPLL